MQLGHWLAAASLLATLVTGPAEAGICTLVVLNSGTLGLSPTATILGSQEGGGAAAQMTIASVGSSTVTVGAPTLTQAPGGYNQSAQILEVSYAGSDVLSSVVHAYGNSSSSFGVPNLLSAVVLTVNNRIRNAAGFASGTYTTRTVVTCS